MNRQYDLSSFETVESMLEDIETRLIVSENDRMMLSKLLEELFWLKEHGLPSSIPAKWAEINKILKSLKAKVNQ